MCLVVLVSRYLLGRVALNIAEYEIGTSEEHGVRYLHFGSDWVQGAMRIARPYALELEYTREMMVPLLLREIEWPRKVLLIGLGAASLTKFLWRYRPESQLTVVEIDPRMETVAKMFFKLPNDPARIRLRIDDGANFVAATRFRYDLILVDGFDADGRAGRLDTSPFYADCRGRLADGGLLCVNLLSRRKDFTRSVERIKNAFDDHAIAFPSSSSGNTIVLAHDGPLTDAPTFEEMSDAARHLRKITTLNLAPTLARLAKARCFDSGVLSL